MGFDISNEQQLATLAASLTPQTWHAAPMLGDGVREGAGRNVCNPADLGDVLGTVVEATLEMVDAACARAIPWAAAPQARADCLMRVADRLEARMNPLVGLIVREAGKTIANAVGEVREAVDFLRYYASEVRGWSNDTHSPLGIVACIS